MQKKRKPPTVKEEIKGTEKIETNKFIKILGEKTFDVWCAFIWRRNFEGTTYVRNISLEKQRNVSKRQLTRICIRLKKAGLLETIERNRIRHERKIYGDYRNGEITLPAGMWSKINKFPKHGGGRKGAGRPIISSSEHIETRENTGGKIIQDVPSKIIQDVPSNNQDVPSNNQDGPHPIHRYKNNSNNTDIFSYRKDDADKPRRFYSFCYMGPNTALPVYPSTSLLKTPRLPPPPKISTESPRESQARMIASAYRGAVESRHSQRCWAFSRGVLTRSRYYKSLCAAADSFIEHDISPAAWCAFSCDVWKEYFAKGSGKPPPVNWAISAKRIITHHGWFGRELVNYSGGQLLFTDSHKDLLRRFDGLRRSLFSCLNSDEIHNMIVEWFPDGWELMYERAKEDAKEDQERITRAVDRGDFVW